MIKDVFGIIDREDVEVQSIIMKGDVCSVSGIATTNQLLEIQSRLSLYNYLIVKCCVGDTFTISVIKHDNQ